MIMMFTDGGEDRVQDVFEKYNWPNRTVSLGPGPSGEEGWPLQAVALTSCPCTGACVHFLRGAAQL